MRVMIDPGHGGNAMVGGSSPNNATGPAGTLEKDLTLAIAGRVRDALAPCGDEIHLTRYVDENLGLADRAALAKDLDADVFLSIHLNAAARPDGSPDPTVNGTETWVHTTASAESKELARVVQAATVGATGLRDRGVRAKNLGVLDPARHVAHTAACLVEISFLTNAAEETRLGGTRYLDEIANALASAVAEFMAVSCVAPLAEASARAAAAARPLRDVRTRAFATERSAEAFDIWHEVPLVPQLTGMSCWAAAAAMVIGWRDRIDVNPADVARGSGRWADYRDGLAPHDVSGLAQAFGLVIEPARALTAERLRTLLETNGPLWLGEASPDLHVIVVAGLYGDGTPDGTRVRVLDPWPEGQGERYVLTVRELLASLRAAEELAGEPTRVLHAGGRGGRAARRVTEARGEMHSSFSYRVGSHADAYPQRRYGTPYGLLGLYKPGPGSAVALQDEPSEEDNSEMPGETPEAAAGDDRDWYSPDELEDAPQALALLVRTDAAYAADADNPDLRHLGHAGSTLAFDLGGDVLRDLFAMNRFDIEAGQDEVLFGLRGCAIAEGPEGVFAPSVQLVEDVPDHFGFHCVLGVFRRKTKEIAVFSGSTVPNWAHMEKQRTQGGQHANLLPTGRYRYLVGQHRAVTGAFILAGEVAVLRTGDDLVYETTDAWERHTPGDNIHPSFSPKDALFSSAGCQTVPGRWKAGDGHSGTWATFREAAGLAADDKSQWGKTYVYCLLTGREARLVSEGAGAHPRVRLRFGSQGTPVEALQRALAAKGLYSGAASGTVDAATSLAYVGWQQARDGGAADGIVTEASATALGFTLG